MRNYAELAAGLRYCSTNAPCEKCPYYRIGSDSCFLQVRSDAADAIEELIAAVLDREEQIGRLQDIVSCRDIQIKKLVSDKTVPHWISGRDVSDEEICAAKMVLSVVENLDKPMLMYDIKKSAVKKALLLMLRICEAEPPKEVE